MKMSVRSVSFSILVCLLLMAPLFAQTVLPNHTPAFASRANDLGASNPNESVKVKVWLKLHNSEQLDQYIEQVYNPSSPKYRQFLTDEQVEALYSPAASEAASIQKFLKAKGLQVTSVGDKNAYVEALGTVSSVQKAFRVQLHNYNVNGKIVRANSSDPTIDDATVAPFVATVGGLSTQQMKPHSRRALTPDGQVSKGAVVTPSATPDGLFFEGNCFFGVETHTFSTSSTSATYTGSRYGAPITNTAPPDLPPCGFSPQDIYAAYNLNGLYNKGLSGGGQSVVIVDAYGSTTAAQDLATFSLVYGLPAPDLKIVGTPVAPGTDTNIQGWMDETTLDIEWAHAIAPYARIVLVIAPTNYDDDLAAAITTAVHRHLGSVVSNSYGGPESQTDPASFAAYETALKLASATGVAVNFSSGDDGDFLLAIGYTDVSYPASSKFATGIGGVSVFLNANQKIRTQTPWGNNLTEIADTQTLGNPPIVPPFAEGFIGGSGGGVSQQFSKPSFQSELPGRHRLVPDISWIADPYTGVEFIETDLTLKEQFVNVIGGTSVACPMFSGLWALASQEHGSPMGQAARSIYGLPSAAITDVTAVDFGTNVTGVVQDSTGKTKETARRLATPDPDITTFTSAFYNSPFSTRWFVLSFGTDSSLPATPGWDPATGLGTPNGLTFVKDVAK